MQVMRTGAKYAEPSFEKSAELSDFQGFACKNYIACPKGCEALVQKIFGEVSFIDGGECAFVTEALTESEVNEKLSKLDCEILSRIRLL